MSNKRLSVLGIMAAVSVVLAVAVWQYANRVQPATSGTGYIIQGLDPAAIARITVKQGENAVTLNRQKNGFVVAEKSNYPAANKIINNLLTSCLDIKTVEFYTEDEKNYKDLGVTEEDAQGIIKFSDVNGKIITGLIIGKDTESGKGTMSYGKLVNDGKVYVLTDIPWLQGPAIDYVNRELLSISRKDIDNVTISSPDETYTLTSEANGVNIVLKDVPTGKKQKDSDCSQVLSVLGNLKFDDVKTEAEMKDLKFDNKISCLLKDSTLFNFEIAKKDSKTYVKCGVEFTDKTPLRKEQEVESQEELKKKEAKLLAKDKAKKFEETTSGWIYEIPSYYADNLTKPMSALVEDIAADANTPVEGEEQNRT